MSADVDRERIRELEARLEESEETLSALRRGDFDAFVVEGPNQKQLVYTLDNADQPYRVLIEQIQEGALTLSLDGSVLYCNRRLAEMLGLDQERVISQPLGSFVQEEETSLLASLLQRASVAPARGELTLRTTAGEPLLVQVSLSPLARDGLMPLLCGVLTDLTMQRQHLEELVILPRFRGHGG